MVNWMIPLRSFVLGTDKIAWHFGILCTPDTFTVPTTVCEYISGVWR